MLSSFCGRVLATGKPGKGKRKKHFIPALTPTLIVADFKYFLEQIQTHPNVIQGHVPDSWEQKVT